VSHECYRVGYSTDSNMFRNIVNTINNAQTYTNNCELTLNGIFETLDNFEAGGNAVILSAKFLKGLALYKYINLYQLKVAEEKFGLRRAQISRYISFYKLVTEYNWLIFVDLDFSKLMKNIKHLKNTLKNYDQLKNSCPFLQFLSV